MAIREHRPPNADQFMGRHHVHLPRHEASLPKSFCHGQKVGVLMGGTDDHGAGLAERRPKPATALVTDRPIMIGPFATAAHHGVEPPYLTNFLDSWPASTCSAPRRQLPL